MASRQTTLRPDEDKTADMPVKEVLRGSEAPRVKSVSRLQAEHRPHRSLFVKLGQAKNVRLPRRPALCLKSLPKVVFDWGRQGGAFQLGQFIPLTRFNACEDG